MYLPTCSYIIIFRPLDLAVTTYPFSKKPSSTYYSEAKLYLASLIIGSSALKLRSLRALLIFNNEREVDVINHRLFSSYIISIYNSGRG